METIKDKIQTQRNQCDEVMTETRTKLEAIRPILSADDFESLTNHINAAVTKF